METVVGVNSVVMLDETSVTAAVVVGAAASRFPMGRARDPTSTL